jgi:uncharacterized protein YjbI with pentapeptide repeats
MANPDHLTRLLEGVHAWNVWRDSQPLTEVDLRGADLAGLDLRGADLWYARLQGAQLGGSLLSGAILDRADLTLADFSGANCYQTRMRGVIADRTRFRGAAMVAADLTLARLLRCELECAIFTGATLLGTNFWGSDHEAALGLQPNTGWIVEEAGAVAEERHSVDRRSFHGFEPEQGSAGGG